MKKQVYWCCWYSPVKMFFGIKRRCFKYMRGKNLKKNWIAGTSLDKSSAKLFVTWEKFNHTCQKGLHERDLQNFRIWINQNTKYCTPKLIIFSVTTCSLSTSKVTRKEWAHVLIVTVSISRYFHTSLVLKTVC